LVSIRQIEIRMVLNKKHDFKCTKLRISLDIRRGLLEKTYVSRKE